MKLIIALIFALILLNSPVLSQNNDSVKHKQDSSIKSSNKHFINNSNERTALFISFKGGHHTINPGYEGLSGNWIADLSFGAIINKQWCISVSFDYSTSKYKNYHFSEPDITVDRTYKENGVNLILKYKYYFMNNKMDIIAGFGVGTYNIKALNYDGQYKGDGYFNYGFRLGMGYSVITNLSLDFEWSLYRLLIMSENKSLQVINNFRIGPTLYLYY